MNETFLREWSLYRQGARRPPITGEEPRGDAAFDGDVKPGEIRIFADANRPFVALIVEERGLSGRRIAPVSPFSAPASARERAVGARVFQLWNVCTASRRFTDRSWLVDSVSAADLAALAAAIPAANPGRITAGDSPQALYEREFLVSGGNFAAFGRAAPLKAEEPPAFGVRQIARMAACFAACVGFFYLLIGPAKEDIRNWKESALVVNLGTGDAVVELLELPDAPEEDADGDNCAFDVDFDAKSLASLGSIPNSVPCPADVPSAAAADPRRIEPLPADDAALGEVTPAKATERPFVDPGVMPLAVVEQRSAAPTSASSAQEGTADARRYDADDAAGEDGARQVECLVAECPWNAYARLLAVRIAGGEAQRVELFFDKTKVGGFRRLEGEHGCGVVYEVLPRPGVELADDFCQVTDCRRKRGGGVARRIVKARHVESLGLETRHPGHEPQKDDIPVELRFGE